jgi:hypothetical protein
MRSCHWSRRVGLAHGRWPGRRAVLTVAGPGGLTAEAASRGRPAPGPDGAGHRRRAGRADGSAGPERRQENRRRLRRRAPARRARPVRGAGIAPAGLSRTIAPGGRHGMPPGRSAPPRSPTARRPAFGATRRHTVNFRRPSAAPPRQRPQDRSRRPGGMPAGRTPPRGPGETGSGPGPRLLDLSVPFRPDRGPASSRRATGARPRTAPSRDAGAAGREPRRPCPVPGPRPGNIRTLELPEIVRTRILYSTIITYDSTNARRSTVFFPEIRLIMRFVRVLRMVWVLRAGQPVREPTEIATRRAGAVPSRMGPRPAIVSVPWRCARRMERAPLAVGGGPARRCRRSRVDVDIGPVARRMWRQESPSSRNRTNRTAVGASVSSDRSARRDSRFG